MGDTLSTWASREWAGVALGFALLLLGAIAWLASGHAAGPPSTGLSIAARALMLPAVLALVGGAWHLWRWSRARRQHPAPGQRVDIGGYRVHLLAEGRADGLPTIVWLPGGHSGGFALHHLHAALRSETRSILFDRPGTGWSDVGPFPRTTAGEAEEVVRALNRAGENGPFVFAGHSFGGLLAANIARRHPELVHSVVLLDPTPLDVIVLGPRLGALDAMRTRSIALGWRLLFGIDGRAADEAKTRRDPATARLLDVIAACLGEAGTTLRAIEGASAGSLFAAASIYRELRPAGLAAAAWETVVYDGDLGDLPLFLVAPKGQAEVDSLPEAVAAAASERQRMKRFFDRARERYLAASTRSQRIVAPAGTGHNFIYEAPEFVIEVMRAIVKGAA